MDCLINSKNFSVGATLAKSWLHLGYFIVKKGYLFLYTTIYQYFYPLKKCSLNVAKTSFFRLQLGYN